MDAVARRIRLVGSLSRSGNVWLAHVDNFVSSTRSRCTTQHQLRLSCDHIFILPLDMVVCGQLDGEKPGIEPPAHDQQSVYLP